MEYLKTNYKNDKFTGMRKYEKIDNPDGTISLKDVTVYEDIGDIYSAGDINATNKTVNEFYDEYLVQVDTVTAVTTINLPAGKWSSTAPFTQTVNVPGLKATDIPVLGLVYPGTLTESLKVQIDKSVNMITAAESLNGAVKLTCKFKKPITDITISLKGV